MSGSIKGTHEGTASGDGSVPDSKTTSPNASSAQASNTPAEVTNGGPDTVSSGHGAGAPESSTAATGGHGAGAPGSSTAATGVDSVPETYQDEVEPVGEDTGANRVSTGLRIHRAVLQSCDSADDLPVRGSAAKGASTETGLAACANQWQNFRSQLLDWQCKLQSCDQVQPC